MIMLGRSETKCQAALLALGCLADHGMVSGWSLLVSAGANDMVFLENGDRVN